MCQSKSRSNTRPGPQIWPQGLFQGEVTTAEFLPHHRSQRQQTMQIISAAEARGQARLVEMNRHVLTNLDRIITALDDEPGTASQETANAS